MSVAYRHRSYHYGYDGRTRYRHYRAHHGYGYGYPLGTAHHWHALATIYAPHIARITRYGYARYGYREHVLRRYY